MTDNRNEERVDSELRTIVQVKENKEETWKEVVTVKTVSKHGAGFDLSRPCGVGQLVALVLPMPRELRAYDLNETAYPVMALIQYCNPITVDGTTAYHVGVAFIGKNVPDSYKANPSQSYRIAGMSAEGLWSVKEADSDFIKRNSPRYWVSVDVSITLINREKQSTDKEQAITQNIGETGAAVFCSLEAKVGDKVKFGCETLDFHSIAIVRNRKVTVDSMPTLHLEFVDRRIPSDKIFSLQMSNQMG